MRVVIGVIVKPHGIKGELKILPETFDLERFYDLDSVFLERGKIEEEILIENVRITTDGKIYLKLSGVDDRNSAENLRGMSITINVEDVLSLPEDTYYFFQLEGMTVFDRVQKKEIGQINDIVGAGSADVYVIKDGDREFMVPALKQFIKLVDVENKRMEIESIPGLLDL